MPALTTRPRLVMLIAIPTALAVALGGISVVSSWRNAVADQGAENLAVLSTKVTQLAFYVEAERDGIVSYIAGGVRGRAALIGKAKNPADLVAAKLALQNANAEIADTSRWMKIVNAGVASVGSGYPAAVRLTADSVAARLASLAGLRRLALTTPIQAADVINEYESVVSVLLGFDDQVALSSTDPQLTSTVHALAQIASVGDADSVQRAVITYGLIAGRLNANLLSELTTAVGQRVADNNDFANFATDDQIIAYQKDLASLVQDRAFADVAQVMAKPNSLATLGIVPADWYGAITSVILGVQHFEEFLAASAVNRAKELRKRAIGSAILVGSLILLMLLVLLLFTLFAGRSTIGPSSRRVRSQNYAPAT